MTAECSLVFTCRRLERQIITMCDQSESMSNTWVRLSSVTVSTFPLSTWHTNFIES